MGISVFSGRNSLVMGETSCVSNHLVMFERSKMWPSKVATASENKQQPIGQTKWSGGSGGGAFGVVGVVGVGGVVGVVGDGAYDLDVAFSRLTGGEVRVDLGGGSGLGTATGRRGRALTQIDWMCFSLWMKSQRAIAKNRQLAPCVQTTDALIMRWRCMACILRLSADGGGVGAGEG